MKYPHPLGSNTRRPSASNIHPTAGLPGNWALDFMAPGGTLILASEAGRVARWSGHDPHTGVHQGDIFGWSLYLDCAMGEYYLTHMGTRIVRPGERVVEGQVLGSVGLWPHDPGRSHTHQGFTSKQHSRSISIARMEKVRLGQKVKPIWRDL